MGKRHLRTIAPIGEKNPSESQLLLQQCQFARGNQYCYSGEHCSYGDGQAFK